MFDGAINGERFRAYVEQMLAPTLRPDDIVLMDNLNSHKVAGIRESTGPPAAPTSIRSNRVSPSSKPSCASWANARSTAYGRPSAAPSTSTHRRNAAISFTTPAMQCDREPL